MDTCPRCDHRVGRLHPIPPEVVSRDLIDAYGDLDAPTDLELCTECTRVLVEGGAVV